jgi:outer membrane protein TolC
MKRSTGLLLSGAALLALSSCAVGPNYHAPHTDPLHAFDAAMLSVTAPGPLANQSTLDLTQWWHSLGDPELDSLIDRAVRANPNIEIALTRLQEVRSQQSVLVGDALPAVSAGGFSGRGTGTDLTKAGASPALRAGDNKGSLAQIRQIAGFSASWELDVFGRLRRAIEAGTYDIQAASWARNAVLTSVIADVASNYVDLRGLQQRMALLTENVASARQLQDFEQSRFDHGLTNELDLQFSARELGRLQAKVPLLQSELKAV